MNFILNEKEFTKYCIEHNTYEKDNIYRTLVWIAQYHYDFNGYRKKKITELLIDFLQKNYPLYKRDSAKWDETADKIAKKTGGKHLLELDCITLTKKEIEIITGIKEKTMQRLAFTMACIARLNKARNPENHGWLNVDSKVIFNAAHVSGTAQQRDYKLHDMQILGLIEFARKIDNNNIRITFLDESDNQEIGYSVSAADFRDLGLCYQYVFNKDHDAIAKCQRCGRYFIRSKANSYRQASKNCPSCIQEEQIKIPKMVTKSCIMCGKNFVTDARAQHKTRCADCQSKWRKMKDRNRKKKPEFSA